MQFDSIGHEVVPCVGDLRMHGAEVEKHTLFKSFLPCATDLWHTPTQPLLHFSPALVKGGREGEWGMEGGVTSKTRPVKVAKHALTMWYASLSAFTSSWSANTSPNED